ncbi:chloride channel protein [Poseidonibacter ostreae]|jgi:H+/Cl- antiporter ClcA|uniref:Voltage-gated chloride channel n=1 Tax=Poseidonibacter ostreae TaxID=2654171 RepID=A0A6L4WRC1_9BACT|nr:chloride channel protein [Poseidonibacter ostreae]KAB7884184.1 voltage-gated chloride channel [Poseidonibacter ostreae]KAB7888090.1 voltage-gated chloride channel [Poseidonibacter ostreae]KAB7891705.1 voltage-gated chloride channel [Poseidonibacter ostreae]MAC82546.1 voltage-gated chloride channel [Arcobacter sp.]
MKKHFLEQSIIFFSVSKWLIISTVIGITIGAIVTFFVNILEYAEDSRDLLGFKYYYLLPFALVFTVWLTKTFAPNAKGHGTEKVIEAIHKKHGKIDILVMPVKLIATVITIFAGGSVGKEGPAAQIGAGAASFIADLFRFSKEHRKKIVICGISAGFAAVFGTPISGAIFGVEVLIVGIIMYDVLLPSFIAGFAAFTTAQFLGLNYTYFDMRFSQAIPLDITLIGQVVLAGIFFGIIADFFITFLKRSELSIKSIKMNVYLKAFLGGAFLVALSFIFGDAYFGLGLDMVNDSFFSDQSLSSDIPWYAFLLKTIFTSVTLGAGGSGGVLTPLFFVGATSGNLFGTLMGDHIAFFSAIGFVSLLAGATNAPIAAIIMAVELFGLEIAPYAAVSVVITFLITGHRSVFPSQILNMKKSEMLDISMGEDIDHSSINVREQDKQKFKDLKQRLRSKNKIAHRRVHKDKEKEEDSNV